MRRPQVVTGREIHSIGEAIEGNVNPSKSGVHGGEFSRVEAAGVTAMPQGGVDVQVAEARFVVGGDAAGGGDLLGGGGAQAGNQARPVPCIIRSLST